MLIDSHANLHGETYEGELDAVFQRASEAGVAGILAICCRLHEIDDVMAIAESRDHVWASYGAHPHHAKDKPDIAPEELIDRADHPKLIAIGETGLDQHYNHSPIKQQVQSFKAHIEAARRTGLPLVIHCRDADERMADLLESEMEQGAFKAVLHSYTGGPDLAQRAARLGFWFSVNGIASFRNARDVRAVIAEHMPSDRIIIETDCPYLAPVPHRGKRNEPSYLPHVVETLTEIRGWSAEETAERTTQAFFALFDKADRP